MTGGHLDLDDLAVRALDGEPLQPDEHAHLAACAACRDEHEALRDIVATGRRMAGEPRAVTGTDTAVAREGTWERIVATLDDEPSSASRERVARIGPRRGRRSLAGLSLAAALVVVALVAAGVGLLDRRDAGITRIALEPLVDGEAATATLRQGPDGRVLDVRLPHAVASPDAFYEVWLIDADVEGMVSLGPATGDLATVHIPDGLDLSAFPILDVSVEPLDGDPRHSGDSRWRGTVPA